MVILTFGEILSMCFHKHFANIFGVDLSLHDGVDEVMPTGHTNRGDNMSNVSGQSNSSSVGFVGLLTIVFVVLKLTGVVRLSWVWVVSPVWITIALCLVAFVVGFLFAWVSDPNRR